MGRGDSGKGARGGVRAQGGEGGASNTWQGAGLEAVSCTVPPWILGRGVGITKAPPLEGVFQAQEGWRERERETDFVLKLDCLAPGVLPFSYTLLDWDSRAMILNLF